MKNEVKTQQDEVETELIDIWYFFQRQHLFIGIIFLSILSLTFSYAITRPTTWQSRASLIVGERLFFSQEHQIEGSGEIKYRYSQNVAINPIKNTRIIEISSTANSKDLAVEQVNKTINEIIAKHREIFEDKKIEFISLLSVLSKDNADKIELMRLLDNASSSTLTKQISDINTEEKPYSGMFLKILAIGSVIGLTLAFLLAVIKDYVERKITN